MINETNKNKRVEMERARYSSFVVDLRQSLNSAAKPSVSESHKFEFKKPKFSLAHKFKGPKLSLRVNLPAIPRIHLHFRSPRSNFFSSHHNLKKSLFRIFKTQRRSANNLWRAAVVEQHRILGARFRFNGQERLAVAENKVVWYRSILSFVLVLIFIIIPIKLLAYFEILDFKNLETKVLSSSKMAFNNLVSAANSVSTMNFQEASTEFSQAGNGFLQAQEDLSVISDSLLFLASLSGDPKMKLAAESKRFLAAGALSSSLGKNLVLATDSLFNQQSDNFLGALDGFVKYGRLAVNDANDLDKIISKINPDNLPEEYRAKFLTLASQTKSLSTNLDNFVSAADKMREVFGLSKDKRYLLIFQNNSELRASGGFLGSYALLDMSGGKIKNLEVPGGGSYDTEGGMSVKVKAPRPLWLVNPLWHFWDANWWPNWVRTSQNLMWFYEKSGGPTVDGVIGITPTVVERLLEITGPIDLTEDYGLVIDSNNFWETVQTVVEHKNLEKTNPGATADFKEASGFKESTTTIDFSVPLEQGLDKNVDNKPKKIIGDLMAKILETLPQKLNRDSLVKIISAFEDSLAEKQIMFYFTDPALESEVSARNYGGEIKNAPRDYLLVVNTNIAGQKSDRKIIEKIEQLSQVSSDGKIINQVKIIRAHSGQKNEILTGVRNVNWLRVYVPAGSRLLSASGFQVPDAAYFEEPDSSWESSELLANEEAAVTDPVSGAKIYQEDGKTVFAGWVMVDPGQTVEINLSYELPFNFFEATTDNGFLSRLNNLLNPDSKNLWSYSLLVQKQPGAAASQFHGRLDIAEPVEIFWKHPDNLSWSNGWEIFDEISADKYFSVLLKK
ncbi:MAG: DUF4012 domain-containing protein [Patescibacteria group bacterium]